MRELCTVGDVCGKTYLPQGYVKANGATVQRADYPRLVNLANRYNLWTTAPATYPALYGKGNGSTTMVLPDWRGVVMRFVDDGKGYDAGRVLGSYQADMILSHAHGATAWTDTQGNHAHTAAMGVIYGNKGNYGAETQYHDDLDLIVANQVTSWNGAHGHNIGISITNTGTTENRAKNIALIPCMRY